MISVVFVYHKDSTSIHKNLELMNTYIASSNDIRIAASVFYDSNLNVVELRRVYPNIRFWRFLPETIYGQSSLARSIFRHVHSRYVVYAAQNYELAIQDIFNLSSSLKKSNVFLSFLKIKKFKMRVVESKFFLVKNILSVKYFMQKEVVRFRENLNSIWPQGDISLFAIDRVMFIAAWEKIPFEHKRNLSKIAREKSVSLKNYFYILLNVMTKFSSLKIVNTGDAGGSILIANNMGRLFQSYYDLWFYLKATFLFKSKIAGLNYKRFLLPTAHFALSCTFITYLLSYKNYWVFMLSYLLIVFAIQIKELILYRSIMLRFMISLILAPFI